MLRWRNSQGRYWKRQLSKARRRLARERLRDPDGHPRAGVRYETECNYKTT